MKPLIEMLSQWAKILVDMVPQVLIGSKISAFRVICHYSLVKLQEKSEKLNFVNCDLRLDQVSVLNGGFLRPMHAVLE